MSCWEAKAKLTSSNFPLFYSSISRKSSRGCDFHRCQKCWLHFECVGTIWRFIVVYFFSCDFGFRQLCHRLYIYIWMLICLSIPNIAFEVLFDFLCGLVIGGRLVYQTTKKRASGPKCPVTGKRIQGVCLIFRISPLTISSLFIDF